MKSEVERREKDAPTEQRRQMRQQDAVPVLAQIEDLVARRQHAVLPQSDLGKALHYTAGQWPKLTRYVQDGRWPIPDGHPNFPGFGHLKLPHLN